jgi:hypothetical protein
LNVASIEWEKSPRFREISILNSTTQWKILTENNSKQCVKREKKTVKNEREKEKQKRNKKK